MKRDCALAVLLILGVIGCARVRKSSPDGEEILRMGNGTIHIHFGPGLPVSRIVVVDWVRRAAVAVTNYLGRYPVNDVLIRVEPGGDEPVNDGVTESGSRIEVHLGPQAQADDLQRDWIM